MGTYIKVVSSVKPINKISVLVNGVIKNIKSGWVFVNGQRKQVFPTTEAWTEIYNNGTPGSYSQTLGFGKYRIVMSGGGGAGGAAISTKRLSDTSVQNGSAGELQDFYFNVAYGETINVSGVVGAGAGGSIVDARATHRTTTIGTPGTGYASGTNGEAAGVYTGGEYYGSVSGSGGGSTNANVGGTNHIAKGGNGGSASDGHHSGTRQPGTGGSGGVSSGTGAAGGEGRRTALAVRQESGAGSNGYIRIYKSNFYPA